MPSLTNKPVYSRVRVLGVHRLAQRWQGHQHYWALQWGAAEMWASLFQTWGVGGGAWGRLPQLLCFQPRTAPHLAPALTDLSVPHPVLQLPQPVRGWAAVPALWRLGRLSAQRQPLGQEPAQLHPLLAEVSPVPGVGLGAGRRALCMPDPASRLLGAHTEADPVAA